jgi:hypothetical protein
VVALVSTSIGWYLEAETKLVWALVPDRTPPGLTDLIS